MVKSLYCSPPCRPVTSSVLVFFEASDINRIRGFSHLKAAYETMKVSPVKKLMTSIFDHVTWLHVTEINANLHKSINRNALHAS